MTNQDDDAVLMKIKCHVNWNGSWIHARNSYL